MHVVVVGCGRVGSELAGTLEKDGHSVAVVDKNGQAFSRLPQGFGGSTVVGFGFDRDHLLEAGIDRAGALAAVTNGDNSNILTARIARENFGIERVVARIYDPRRAVIYQRLGIPTVATVSWATDQVIRRLLPGEVKADWSDPTRQDLRRRAGAAGRLGGQEAGRAQRAGPVLADGRHPARGGPHRQHRRRRPGRRRPHVHGRHRRPRRPDRTARGREGPLVPRPVHQ